MGLFSDDLEEEKKAEQDLADSGLLYTILRCRHFYLKLSTSAKSLRMASINSPLEPIGVYRHRGKDSLKDDGALT